MCTGRGNMMYQVLRVWTLLAEERCGLRDSRFFVWLAWRLPRNLVKWCAVGVMTYHWEGDLLRRSCLDALQAWIEPGSSVAAPGAPGRSWGNERIRRASPDR